MNMQPIKAMLFAAGLGTRLKPFTEHHPKALAVVNGKTLLERNIAYLNSFGIKDIVVNVHHFADQVIDFLQQYANTDNYIAVSHEVEGPYETGGGLAFAASHFKDAATPFVVMNVDMLTNLDLRGMIDFHLKISPLATLAVTKRESSRQFLFDDEMRLVGWRNNLTGETKWSVGEVEDVQPRSFSGIHVIDPAIFALMPASGTFSITDVYLQLAANSLVVGYDHTGDIILDVGKPESLVKAAILFQ
jgi:NDP-sugar pyrophosphorylase family protein